MKLLDVALGNSTNMTEDLKMRDFSLCEKKYVYGAGKGCMDLLESISVMEVSIDAIIVSDGHKNEDYISGIPVKELSEVSIKAYDGIIVSIYDIDVCHEIYEDLLKRGIESKSIYFRNIDIEKNIKRNNKIKSSLKTSFFSKYKELEAIGKNNGTDKSSVYHNYLNKYEFFLNRYKNEKITLLELGVYKGGSVKTWNDYFSEARIIGVDIDKECKKYEKDRIEIILGNLNEEKFLEKLTDIDADVVIDDASHKWSEQIKALCYILPRMKKNSVYILEDLETSFYEESYKYARDAVITAYDFCSICSRYITSKENLSSDIADERFIPLVYLCCEGVEMISFIEGSCIFCK